MVHFNAHLLLILAVFRLVTYKDKPAIKKLTQLDAESLHQTQYVLVLSQFGPCGTKSA
jgi:hypothetical protein